MPPTVILPYTPKRTTVQDIELISQRLHRRKPDFQLMAFDSEIPPVALADVSSPQTITVTLNNNNPDRLFAYLPGPKFFATNKSKYHLIADLVSASIPMPYTELFSPDMTVNEEKFGRYITIKTMAPGTSKAKGIHVFKTHQFDELRDRLSGSYEHDIAMGHIPVLQQYIPTGPRPTHTRVTTFLGAPIVCFSTMAPDEFSPEALTGLVGGEATSNSRKDRTRYLTRHEGMENLAQKICAVFPETSVLSIDMVQCAETQKIYCIEANLGNLCVLSAPICGALRHDLGAQAVYKQFGSYDTIARRMIETMEQTAPIKHPNTIGDSA